MIELKRKADGTVDQKKTNSLIANKLGQFIGNSDLQGIDGVLSFVCENIKVLDKRLVTFVLITTQLIYDKKTKHWSILHKKSKEFFKSE